MKAEMNKDPGLATLFSRGEHMIWITGAALSLSLLLVAGLLALVCQKGMGYFWPREIVHVVAADGKNIMGAVMLTESFRRQDAAGRIVEGQRSNFKVANRDVFGIDFRWVEHSDVGQWSRPADAVQIERWEYGDFIGFPKSFQRDGATVAEGAAAWSLFLERLPAATRLRDEIRHLEKDGLGTLNTKIRAKELAIRKIEFHEESSPARDAKTGPIHKEIEDAKVEFDKVRERLGHLVAEASKESLTVATADGREKAIPMDQIVRAHAPNIMSFWAKSGHYLTKIWEYASGEPREANTEGGVFPAIFGTVMMTLILAVIVAPLGVLAAFYLREYASQGPVVRAVRIAINNLAGVPSIVFGVFGLGFFVYSAGGTIDSWLYPEVLPTPTFGTGGILWASLTLALLTVPVVIVATEESIAAVPRGMREGSLALGATKFQTVCRIIFPAAVPGMLTGLILAMARGAGEVAPLMITGVVKLAPALPVDFTEPFVHLERKFMHLAFHIYDVGFQSPNIEAAKPMVYTTTLLLLAVVVVLNVAAIRLRDRIRKKYQTGAFS